MRNILAVAVVLLFSFGLYHGLTTKDCNKGDFICESIREQAE